VAEAAFGLQLRRSRQAAALSLRQLAARVGYDHSYLSQVERGDCCPFACSFLSGGVENLIQYRLPVVVLLRKDSRRDLDQKAIQFALVPL